ncbi:MAG: hypothetical protein HQL08_03220 [Nitrospirae bacterium]|nr:hypothetical protein [Nitrospirota bacterium]
MTPYEFIQQQNIFTCNICAAIIQLQANRNIDVCPLFWQGEGVENIPLVILGSNPSVVGTTNEPRRGECIFHYYFDYYQNRTESENINKTQARALGIRIPLRHWTMCHNLAKKLIAPREVQRWKDYVIMEAIHCFYNSEDDLNEVQRAMVASTCFSNHTLKQLLFLKPKMIILLGDTPFELLEEYLGVPHGEHGFYRITLTGELNGATNTLSVPVMRHRHPNFHGKFYFADEVYNSFRVFAGFNGGQP